MAYCRQVCMGWDEATYCRKAVIDTLLVGIHNYYGNGVIGDGGTDRGSSGTKPHYRPTGNVFYQRGG